MIKKNYRFYIQVQRVHCLGSPLKSYFIGSITQILQEEFQSFCCIPKSIRLSHFNVHTATSNDEK